MIDVRDLMIGNKIKANDVYQGRIMTFDRFNEDKTVIFFSDGHKWGIGEFIKDCEAVPLSEEIILKCGFEKVNVHKDNRMYVYQINGIDIIGTTDNGKTFFICGFTENGINYLHEVQNLVRVALKQELEIKW